MDNEAVTTVGNTGNSGGGESFVSNEYTQEFYEGLKANCESAKVIVPMVLDLFGRKRVHEVVDFGCGTGQWLAVFREQGCLVKGFDSDRVDPRLLVIPTECFSVADLTKPVSLEKRYDMAVSIEVAEHLDEQFADTFIDTITSASDLIMFSAAVPHQDGTHHVNCRWQSYWIQKFADRGYIVLDYVRPRVWGNKEAVWWHKENTLLFCKDDKKYVDVLRLSSKGSPHCFDIVHPEHWEYMYDKIEWLQNDNTRLRSANDRMKRSLPLRVAARFHRCKPLYSIYSHTIKRLIHR